MATEPNTRIFKVTDNNMLQYAKALRLIFMEDQAAFVLRDPDFATPYETNWDGLITTAESHPTDEQVDDLLTQKTNDVEAQMRLCRNKWMDTKPFIKKAFPNNPTIWNEFGFNDYKDVDHSQAGLIKFMRLVHLTAVKYTAQLTAVNYTIAMIAEIETLRAALSLANDLQEKFKKDIPVLTQQRVDKHNAVYTVCQTVCETGKLIFRDDYANYQKYLLPASDESPALFILKGKVIQPAIGPPPTPGSPASGGTPVEDVTVTVQGLPAITTQTDSNGNYGFGSIPPGTYTINFGKPGYMPHSVPGVVITDLANAVTLNVTLTPMP
ncbi:MAG: hypothetical protein POELPBGB_00182 [Bacteroidia bacterium]|nr:hypothetical protein [Bacteroidia bacterium]